MRKRRSVQLFVTLVAGLLPVALRAQEPPTLPTINVDHFFPVVREQVEKALETARANPKSAEVSGTLGMVLDTYEQYDSAAICYQRARWLDPISFRWAYYLGWVEAARGRFSEAENILRESLRMNPRYLPARLRLAEALMAAGKWKECGDLYAALTRDYPQMPAGHYGLGRVHSARGDSAAAIDSLEKACQLFPPYGAAHYALALAYRRVGPAERVREHLKLYEQSRTSVPGVEDPLRSAVEDLNLGPLGHMRRGVTLEQEGKIQEAIAEQEMALDADPKQIQVHINLIALYGRTNEFEKAEEHYRAAIDLNPNQAEAYYNYGVLLMRQGQNQRAEQAFGEVVRINPFYAEAHHSLGFLLERQGRLDQALEQYNAALANRPNYPLAHFHAGRILVNQNHYEEAIGHFLKTLTSEDENTPRFLYALAATYARAGRRERALEYFLKARDSAAARRQTELLRSIERDLEALRNHGTQPK
ncbi:MAG: tetratricopeptide repeat protein [Terriglobia bacterium]